jgi:hypothetical protein
VIVANKQSPYTQTSVLKLWVAMLALSCASLAQGQKNLVYINSNINITGQNTVIALVNDGAGNLSQVAGSPFPTGGTGVGGSGDLLNDTQWDADGQIVVNPTGTLLFAADGHSNDIASFTINADGSLTAAPGSPFASGGTQPASLGYQANALGNGASLLLVANKDSDLFQTQTAPNYTTFAVNSAGVLTMNAGSTFPLPAGSSPSHVLLRTGVKSNFFGILYKGKKIASYKLTGTGTMTRTSLAGLPGLPVGGVLNPLTRGIYVTNASTEQISVFSYDTTFKLTLVKSLPDPGRAVCWATTNAAGTRMYTGETLSGSVTVWNITNSKSPVALQTLVMSGTTPYATHVRLDPTEKFLYVLDRQGVLHVLDVASDGTVGENHTPFNLNLPDNTVPPLGLAVLLK